jgi:hypothetical protein
VLVHPQFIISRGVCEVFLRDPWEQRTSVDLEADQEILLSNGQFFGEISLLMEVRRTTSVQAKTICEVNVLVQEIFEEILRESPDFADEMKSLIVQRKVENFKKLNHESPTEMDEEMIEYAVTEAIESRQLTIGGDRGVGQEEQEEEGDIFQGEQHHLPGMMEEDEEEEEEGEEGESVQALPDRDAQVTNKKVDLSVRRLSQSTRSPSGLALGNMAGAGMIDPRKMEGVERSLKDNKHAQQLASLGQSTESVAPPAEKGGALTGISEGDSSGPRMNDGKGKVRGNEGPPPVQSKLPSKRNVNLARQGTRHDVYTPVMGAAQMPGALNRDDSMLTTNQEMAEMDDVVSQQLALLQERIDKIYAMLTSKLGRVR